MPPAAKVVVLSEKATEEEAIVSPAEKALEPVLAALETYHQKHGLYPAALDDLVNDSLLSKRPELPVVKEANDSGLEYQASPSPDFFVIAFYYFDVGISKSTFSVKNYIKRVYASDDQRGWLKPESPFVSMGDLIADHLAPSWRKNHDSEILGRFITEAIGKADCEFLLQKKIVDWLGKGAQIQIPTEVLPSDRTGFCYQAKDHASQRYCFAYKNQWFGHWTCPSVDGERALAKGPTVYENHPVLDKLFLIRRDKSGKESWEVIRECPPSNRDRRPKPSSGTVVLDD